MSADPAGETDRTLLARSRAIVARARAEVARLQKQVAALEGAPAIEAVGGRSKFARDLGASTLSAIERGESRPVRKGSQIPVGTFTAESVRSTPRKKRARASLAPLPCSGRAWVSCSR